MSRVHQNKIMTSIEISNFPTVYKRTDIDLSIPSGTTGPVLLVLNNEPCKYSRTLFCVDFHLD